MPNKERKLKILPKFFPRAWQQYVVFPEIRLAGKWLQDLGFTHGRFVSIAQEGNTLTITILPEAEVQPEVKKATRKKQTAISPELDALPGDQLFQVWAAEDYHAYVAEKQAKQNKKAAPCGTAHVIGVEDEQSMPETFDQPFQPQRHEETNHRAHGG